jgi:ribosome-associated protein
MKKKKSKTGSAKKAGKKRAGKPAKKTAKKTASKSVSRMKSQKPSSRKPERKSIAKAPDAAASKSKVLNLILARLDEDQAANTIQIDLHNKSTIADYMVVTSGRSNRHVNAIADHVIESLHKSGAPRVRVEGMPNCDWVLIDAGDVILHIFRPEVRSFYNLEKMWARGPAQG